MGAQRNYPADRARPVKPTDPAQVARLERDLRTVMRRYSSRDAALAEAAAERDRVIRDAHAAGIPPKRIVAITGLTAQRVDQIRRADRI